MASEQKAPLRSILKASSSFDNPEHHDGKKEMKWDEMNILATYHPEGKEYGHKKIDEPPTPYNYDQMSEDDQEGGKSEEEGGDRLDPHNLASKLEASQGPVSGSPAMTDEEEEDEKELTEEERAKQKLFEQKRKFHYNEFQAVKLARQLMEEDEEEDEEAAEDGQSSSK